jgi:hypothetical protein
MPGMDSVTTFTTYRTFTIFTPSASYAGLMDCGKMKPATCGVKLMVLLCSTGCEYCNSGMT